MSKIINYPFYGISIVINNSVVVVEIPDFINDNEELTCFVARRIADDVSFGIDVSNTEYVDSIRNRIAHWLKYNINRQTVETVEYFNHQTAEYRGIRHQTAEYQPMGLRGTLEAIPHVGGLKRK